tara:strand:- start:35 stop:373 length:339 start_codon:yes stop_codon:yes gene_type:complete
MDEMIVLSINEHQDLNAHSPLAILSSEEGFTLLLAKTQNATYLVIAQHMGRTVSTLELASARYAEFVIQLIDEHIRQHPGLQSEELNTHIVLKAKDHLPRTAMPGDFLGPAA